ncbi:hypothetical protein FOZ61_010215 [Perkinsus olseni]|uniref:AAA+ ATPase domain-containing protein n=1 Tax=Perkinsus olseni TaxID=32597 RepID=A0A7J6L2A3_PEROL|nr:hypothetical protein FOZ61_010215 [Perkinsus olseni]KAF4653578.1 hypothetical protein FOL46_009100 [Perkinsus olseni]
MPATCRNKPTIPQPTPPPSAAPKAGERSWGDTTFNGRYPPLLSNLYVEKFSDAHAKLLHECLTRGEAPPLVVSHLQYETILSRRLCRVKLEQRRVLLGLNADGRRVERYKWKTRSDYANSRVKYRGQFVKEKFDQLAIEDKPHDEGKLQLEDTIWIPIDSCWIGEPKAAPDLSTRVLHRHSHRGLSFDLRGLTWEFRIELIQIFVIELTLHFINLQSIVYLQTLLSVTDGASAADFTFLSANVALWLLRTHATYWLASIKAYMSTALTYAVHCVSLDLPAEASRGHSLTNLLLSDTAVAVDGLTAVVAAWRLPIEFLSAFYLLWTNLTYGVVPCLLVVIILRCAALVLSFMDGNLRKAWQSSRDDRITLCEEAFSPPSCASLARLGWTRVWVQFILRSRETELRLLGKREWMRKIREGIDYAQPVIVQFVAVLLMVTTASVDPAAVVPTSLMLASVAAPVNQFTGVVLSLLECRSALQRLQSFCKAVPHPSSAEKTVYKLDPTFLGRVVAIGERDGSAVTGSLLASSTDTVVVRKSPRLLFGCGDTVRENVLFGLRCDDVCLDKAMRLACLTGVPPTKKVDTLSMGQGARVCLARSYYRILCGSVWNAVLFLEEPCIFLDPGTSAMVVANMLELLEHSASIIVLTEHLELLSANLPAEALLVVGARSRIRRQKPSGSDVTASIGNAVEEKTPLQKQVPDSQAVAACVPLQAYSMFLGYVGYGYSCSIMLLIAGIMGSQQSLDVLLSRVTDGELALLWRYAVVLSAFLLCNFAAFHVEVTGGLRGAEKLFTEFVSELPRSVFFVDAVEASDNLSRLTSDVNVSDHTLTRTLGVLWGGVLYLFVKIFFMLITSESPAETMLVIVSVVLAFELMAARPFRPANRGAHRRAAAALTPVVAAAHGSFEIRDTVREYGATSWVTTQFLARAAESARWHLVEEACRCWLSLRLELIGFLLTAQVTLAKPIGDPVLAGMLITAARAVSGIVQQLIHNCADIERDFVSVQRLSQKPFCEQDRESAKRRKIYSENTIVMCKASVGYGESVVLRGVDLVVHADEKVALVGPSGSGKTTLLNSILGAAKVFSGSLLICGLSPDEATTRRFVQCVPHSPVIFRGSLRRNLDPDGCMVDSLLQECLRAVGLPERVCTNLDSDASDVVKTTTDRLRVCLARVVLAREFSQLSIVLLDECAGVFSDKAAREFVGVCLRLFESQTVVMTTHRPFLTELFDRTVMIE